MLMVTTGINYSSSLLAQSGAHLKAAAEVASGEGHFKAGAILALDSNGDYVAWDPDASDSQTEYPRAVALEAFNTRSDSTQVIVGFWGAYTLSKVFVPATSTQNGDGTTADFSVGETIVNNSVVVYADGSLKTEGTHYNVNYSTGLVSFTSGNEPANDTGNVVIYYGQELTEANMLTCQDYSLFLINIVG